MNITDPIWRNAHAHPERQAVVFDGHPISYASLCATVERVASRLAASGVRRSDCVAVSLHSPLGYLVTVLALARMGAVPTALKSHWPSSLKETLLKRHGAHSLVQDADDGWRCEALTSLQYLQGTALFTPSPGESLQPAPVAQDADDEPWLIALSSGTTGVPKSVPQTHARALQTYTLAYRSALVSLQRVLVFTDLSISLGMGNVMRALIAGGTVVLATNPEPQNFFAVVERDQPQRVVTSTGLAATLVTYAAQQLPQSRSVCASVQTIQVAGSAVSPALRTGIEQRICPQLEINYGSTEAGGLAMMDAEVFARHPTSAGRIYPWVQAQAVNAQDQPLPSGQQGLLRFKTPLLVSGYLKDAEATARMFRRGWYYPGDMGSVDAAGYLMLAGRVDHVLNVGGNKLDPVLIEQVLNSHPAVMESAVVAVPHGETGNLVLVAVVVPQAPVEAQELQQLCQDRLGMKYVPAFVGMAAALPKNAGGKVMRGELAAQVRIGQVTSKTA